MMEIMPILIFRSEIPYKGQQMWSKVFVFVEIFFSFPENSKTL